MQIQNPDLMRICSDVLFSMQAHVRLCTYGVDIQKRGETYAVSLVCLIQAPWIRGERAAFQPERAPTLETLPNSPSLWRTPKIWSLSVMMVLFNMRPMKFPISVARKPSVFPKMQELLPLIGRQLQKVTSGVWIDSIYKSWVEGEADEWLIAVHQVGRELQLWEQG